MKPRKWKKKQKNTSTPIPSCEGAGAGPSPLGHLPLKWPWPLAPTLLQATLWPLPGPAHEWALLAHSPSCSRGYLLLSSLSPLWRQFMDHRYARRRCSLGRLQRTTRAVWKWCTHPTVAADSSRPVVANSSGSTSQLRSSTVYVILDQCQRLRALSGLDRVAPVGRRPRARRMAMQTTTNPPSMLSVWLVIVWPPLAPLHSPTLTFSPGMAASSNVRQVLLRADVLRCGLRRPRPAPRHPHLLGKRLTAKTVRKTWTWHATVACFLLGGWCVLVHFLGAALALSRRDLHGSPHLRMRQVATSALVIAGRRYRARWKGERGSQRGLWKISVIDPPADCDHTTDLQGDAESIKVPRRARRMG